jgi:hypothetical protein
MAKLAGIGYRAEKEVFCSKYVDGIIDDDLEAFAKLVAEKERETCAKVCETLELPEWPDKVRQPLAQAIRARGNHD